MESRHVAQVGPELLDSSDPLISASQTFHPLHKILSWSRRGGRESVDSACKETRSCGEVMDVVGTERSLAGWTENVGTRPREGVKHKRIRMKYWSGRRRGWGHDGGEEAQGRGDNPHTEGRSQGFLGSILCMPPPFILFFSGRLLRKASSLPSPWNSPRSEDLGEGGDGVAETSHINSQGKSATFQKIWTQCCMLDFWHAGLSDGAGICLELEETLDTSSALLFRQQLAGMASQSEIPLLLMIIQNSISPPPLQIHEKEEEEFNEKSENDSGINEEPLLTADQVIEEIEEMMQNSPDPEEEEEVLEEEDGGETSSQADSVLLQEMQALTQTFNNNWSYEGLRHMSGSELTDLLDQVEGAIRDFSEELVQQLARRDELEFEKEVKNSFITVLIEVQNKQKEQRELMKKRRKEKGLSLQSSRIEKGNQMPLKRFSMEGISNILQSGIRQTFGSSGTDKQYLNTVIPYEKKASPPSVEDLQMLTNSEFFLFSARSAAPFSPFLPVCCTSGAAGPRLLKAGLDGPK
ncbi:Fasciculation and elongation protein zeta-1 [Plecturocebus cupreus]